MSTFANLEDYLKGLFREKVLYPERVEAIDAEVSRVQTDATADVAKASTKADVVINDVAEDVTAEVNKAADATTATTK